MGVNMDGKDWFMLRTDTIQITPELLALIAEIDEFKGAWRALGTLAPERLKALRRIATIESIGSSTRIEGSKLTDREVERLLANLQIRKFDTRDEQEVAGYAEVMETIFQAWPRFPPPRTTSNSFTATFCATATRTSGIAANTRPCQQRGCLSTRREGKSGSFSKPRPRSTRRAGCGACRLAERGPRAGAIHPLLIVAVFIVVFLEIHPFQDGNGRLSRILTTLLMLQAGYAYVPYSRLKA
jgi:Fic family protein